MVILYKRYILFCYLLSSFVGDFMACYHPIDALRYYNAREQKYQVRFMKLSDFGKPLPDGVERIQIPCGKCDGCRLDHSRQWANRCMLELQYHKSSYFVTLTYDDQHVPWNMNPDVLTGEVRPAQTLDKRDWQLFMKRLRKAKEPEQLRFFMAGEYGSTTLRPHYHAIIFGLALSDLVPWSRTKHGDTLFRSAELERLWSKGFVTVGHVSWKSCAYVARYVMKKAHGNDAKYFEDLGMLPEFTLQSRRPGIARQYYDQHPDLYDSEYINVSTEDGGQKFPPPKYFDRLKAEDDPEFIEALKKKRRDFAEAAMKAKLEKTSLDEHDYLTVAESANASKIKSLRRDQI